MSRGLAPAARAVRHEALELVVLMLSPIVPHISHTLWRALGHAGGATVNLVYPEAPPPPA